MVEHLDDLAFDPATLQKKKKDDLPKPDPILYQPKDEVVEQYLTQKSEYFAPELVNPQEMQSSALEDELRMQETNREMVDENFLRLKEQEDFFGMVTKKEELKFDYIASAREVPEAPKNKVSELLFLFETDKSDKVVEDLKKHFKLMLQDHEHGLVDQEFVNSVVTKLKDLDLDEEIVLENLKNA
ncbi:MAG: hypothetical protein ABIF40_02095 [archaeon]